MEASTDTVLWSISAAGKRLDLGRSTLYRLMDAGELAFVKIGGRRLIPDWSLRHLINEHLVGGPAETEPCSTQGEGAR